MVNSSTERYGRLAKLAAALPWPAALTLSAHPSGNDAERIAVGRGARDLRRRRRAGRAGARLDDHRLAERARQPVGNETGNDVGWPAGRKAVNDGDGARWPIRFGASLAGQRKSGKAADHGAAREFFGHRTVSLPAAPRVAPCIGRFSGRLFVP
jgi:hypothetical protein